MTDKLHCPYCGEELSNDFGVIFCYNEACEIYGCELNEQVIRDIIDGKKAQNKLNKVDAMLFSLVLKAHDLTALDLLRGITDIRLKIIKFITKQEN